MKTVQKKYLTLWLDSGASKNLNAYVVVRNIIMEYYSVDFQNYIMAVNIKRVLHKKNILKRGCWLIQFNHVRASN